MLFNSVSYLLFLALASAAFWLLPAGRRIWVLLVASVVFYGLWRPEFLLLIAFSALVDYAFALTIHREQRTAWRKLWLICSLATNLGLLGYFKYTYFALGNLAALGGLLGRDWTFDPGTIILPLGISFYTFLSISYTIDVYRGLTQPTRSFATYLTYVMFWPHMIAGPILRAHELIPQLIQASSFDRDRCADGVRMILFGLFLKVALADQLAPFVDDAFLTQPATLSALDVWTMAFAFGLQIYFDFAGYSMIAIGSARLVGVHFPENFNWPYLATSPREFWRRWHITLSSWIRDYLYLPLAGRRFQDRSEGGLEVAAETSGTARLTYALFFAWFLMGLWHGASWTFALWGLWHATFIWLYRLALPLLGGIPKRVRAVAGWAITLAVTMLAWIPFRARTLDDTFVLLGRVLDPRAYTYLTFRETFYLAVAVVFAGILTAHFADRWLAAEKYPTARQAAEVALTAVAGFTVFIFLRPVAQFIYFQF